MKLRPVVVRDLPLNPIEWHFKKHKVVGRILYRKVQGDYIYELEHSSFKYKKISSLDDGESFLTLEEAGTAAEKWIDLWYSVQGRILSFGAF
ncbi:MAG TPA: hypothetical protein VNM69_06470 [Bacillus sp. (in: firmicutes)]|nr:hypothetical protein [Bacillus sp. (in: firmicutes)]